jgi:hypothetical protein
MSFLKVPAPPKQPLLLGRVPEDIVDLFTPPERLPNEIAIPDLTTIPLPTRELLADRSALS